MRRFYVKFCPASHRPKLANDSWTMITLLGLALLAL
jgi:hypothetical protein